MKQIGIRKQMLLIFTLIFLLTAVYRPVYAEDENPTVEAAGEENQNTETGPAIASPSAILIEGSTGQVIYEKDADMKRSPASITKIMTLLLIFEDLDSGKIHLNDDVVTSAHAKSMGGSQVFLEEGEVQSVETMIKCIVIASGNDAAVAMAEKISGSEEEFVKRMNQKAQELGMENTHFEDCCGLTNSENHYTTAKDVAIMSRELITRYPAIFDYTKIWMEDITHVTKKGSSTFTLSSTNKLLKQYEYTTGLKTGSTSLAKYCLSATARKNDIDMIAVVMAAPDYKVRFNDARTLLEYGFNCTSLYQDKNEDKLDEVLVNGGLKETVPVKYADSFQYLDLTGADISQVRKEVSLTPQAEAPVQAGGKAGEAKYYLGTKMIGSVDILFAETIEKAVYRDYIKKVFGKVLL